MPNADSCPDAAAAAQQLALVLADRSQDYALGGAIALGYWGAPRGTVDVDLTLYLPPDKPSECIWLLQEIGCDVSTSSALQSLSVHGFCRVAYRGLPIDVFLPTIPFYEAAKARRKRVQLGDQEIVIWDAESLAVFKMMFFRRKDIADVEQILRVQGGNLNRKWIQQQLEGIYGTRDPRVQQWKELVAEIED